jgi:vitamin B12 transporter
LSFFRIAFFAGILLAGPAAASPDHIVVTATRTAEDPESLPFSIDSIPAERWEAAGGDAEAALSTVPGVSFTSSGGPGQTKSLLLRGAKAEHTLVLIDGIPVNDPLSPSRAFDFGQIPVSEIDHVEILKGPQSVLYGSDAMGGVVQIFTKKTGSRARAEGGSYHTFSGSVSSMGFRAGGVSSRGYSSADEREGNTEPDGYRAYNLGGTQEFPLNDRFLMRLNAQYQDSRADTDKNGGRGGDSFNTYASHSQFLLREENVVLLPGEAELTVAGNYASHYRTDNTNGGDYYRGNLWKAEAIAKKPLGPQRFTLGAEYGDEGGSSSQTSGGRRDFREGAAYLQDELALSSRVELVAGGRVDLHSETRTAGTYRLGLNWWLVPEFLRARGSVSSGFKAPSLYQTYSIYGSPSLLPERSFGGEAGLEAKRGYWRSELTWFTNRFRDLIDFNLVTNRYFNQSRALTTGVEWGLGWSDGRLRADNALTYLRAIDPDTGVALLRRPRWTDSLTLGAGREKKWGTSLNLRYVGERQDAHPLLLTRQTMPAYLTLGADLFREIGDGLRLTARGVNLFDRRYQETSGFGVPGLSGYAGIEADL